MLLLLSMLMIIVTLVLLGQMYKTCTGWFLTDEQVLRSLSSARLDDTTSVSNYIDMSEPCLFMRIRHLTVVLWLRYDSLSDVGEIRVYQRADFQSGSRVLKKVFWTFSYLYLWHTMWFHAKKLLRTLKFWKSLNSLCKSGSRPQKSPKKAQKTDHSKKSP